MSMNILQLLTEDVSSAGSFEGMKKALSDIDIMKVQQKANKLVKSYCAHKEGKGSNPHTVGNLKNNLSMIMFGYYSGKNKSAKKDYTKAIGKLNKELK